MAQKKRPALSALILTLLLCLAATGATAAGGDAKKYPPVAGEIYGQTTAGVRSITVNGKPVTFDANQNFRAAVNLKAGEKYLVLRINFEGLRIIKKYLILRKSPINKFKVYVSKEKIEKAVQATSPPAERPAPKLARKPAPVKRRPTPAQKISTEKRWVETVASPRFFPKEFKGSAEVAALTRAITRDKHLVKLATGEAGVAQLNELIKVPNFYELIRAGNKKVSLSPRLKRLVKETDRFRGRAFSGLSEYEQKKVMVLNRLLIEELYTQAPKRKSWAAPAPPPPSSAPTTQEYLYVWEFSEGKLLLVKESQGQYSAEILMPVSKDWLDLKGLSQQELKELIKKPAPTFKPPTK